MKGREMETAELQQVQGKALKRGLVVGAPLGRVPRRRGIWRSPVSGMFAPVHNLLGGLLLCIPRWEVLIGNKGKRLVLMVGRGPSNGGGNRHPDTSLHCLRG